MKGNRFTLTTALAALLLAATSFIFNGSDTAQAQVSMKPYPMGTTKIEWDYDSGWVEVPTGQEKILNHNLGGDPSEYFVFFVGMDEGAPDYYLIHQMGYGGLYPGKGCSWRALDDVRIVVYREGVDLRWDKCRVRILKNQ